MTLKLKVGKKGYIIIPKALRRVYGIKEGDHVIAEARNDGILLKPARNIDFDKLDKIIQEHREKLSRLDTISPKMGELAKIYLEEEFEE